MAKKREPKLAAEAADQGAADELDVLHPERIADLSIGPLTVREYGAIEWLRMQPAVAPLVDRIAEMLAAATVPTYEEALAAIAEHIDGLLPIIAMSVDMPPEPIAALNPADAELLLMTWWGVNGRFFVGRAMNRLAVARAEERAKALAQSAGASSTRPLSQTDTTDTTSA